MMGAIPWPSDHRRIARWLSGVTQALQTREFRKAWKQGQTWSIDQSVAQVHTFTTGAGSAARTRSEFTERERQIIVLLAQALTNDEIAAQLAIRPATARTHVEHVMTKLGLHRRAELVLWASKQ